MGRIVFDGPSCDGSQGDGDAGMNVWGRAALVLTLALGCLARTAGADEIAWRPLLPGQRPSSGPRPFPVQLGRPQPLGARSSPIRQASFAELPTSAPLVEAPEVQPPKTEAVKPSVQSGNN